MPEVSQIGLELKAFLMRLIRVFMLQIPVTNSLMRSLEKLDLKNPADSHAYLVRLKVLTKAF